MMDIIRLEKGATPRQWGIQHGAAFPDRIRALAEIRIELAISLGAFSSPAAVLSSAAEHLALLRAFDGALYEELLGVAEGSGCSPDEIVVLNHYTDLRDIGVQSQEDDSPADLAGDGCTLVYARTPAGPVVAQTWDTHRSATDYVCLINVPAHDDPELGSVPEAWLFSIIGCLGMAGSNADGVAVAINNLKSLDAKVGIVWPALIRRMLKSDNARRAADILRSAPIGSGHHYLIADKEDVIAIETSGERLATVFSGEAATFVHTNHCLDDSIAAVSRSTPTSTTRVRFARMNELLADGVPKDSDELWQMFGDSVLSYDLSTDQNPHGVATCGAVLMSLSDGVVIAQEGLVNAAVSPVKVVF